MLSRIALAILAKQSAGFAFVEWLQILEVCTIRGFSIFVGKINLFFKGKRAGIFKENFV
mgnify:CR=1